MQCYRVDMEATKSEFGKKECRTTAHLIGCKSSGVSAEIHLHNRPSRAAAANENSFPKPCSFAFAYNRLRSDPIGPIGSHTVLYIDWSDFLTTFLTTTTRSVQSP
jgi:hypothetical protein